MIAVTWPENEGHVASSRCQRKLMILPLLLLLPPLIIVPLFIPRLSNLRLRQPYRTKTRIKMSEITDLSVFASNHPIGEEKKSNSKNKRVTNAKRCQERSYNRIVKNYVKFTTRQVSLPDKSQFWYN